MYIHEYQAKRFLSRFGVMVPKGRLVATYKEAEAFAEELGGKAVVKAQIHAGGRGAAGGVLPTDTPREAAMGFRRLLGRRLVTKQTGPEGRLIRLVMIEERLNIERELYLAMFVDRRTARITIMASKEGGVRVEEDGSMAAIHVDPVTGPLPFAIRGLARALSLDNCLATGFLGLVERLYTAFVESDCSLLEINPLGVIGSNLVALDAKMEFDDNALSRHADIKAMRDIGEEDPKEARASDFGLSYVRLDGDIACLVNGAGLAMATLDALEALGGHAANFLDLGGAADDEAIRVAFELLLGESEARCVLVNVFGGIVRCDSVANAMVESVKSTGSQTKAVVRFEGNRAGEGRQALAPLGAQICFASSLGEAIILAAGEKEEACRR